MSTRSPRVATCMCYTGYTDFHAMDRGTKIFFILLVVLVASASFALGRFSVIGIDREEGKAEFIIPTLTDPSVLHDVNFPYVASVSGERYYPKHCTLVSHIKEENKIYFLTGEEAEDAGYTLTAGC